MKLSQYLSQEADEMIITNREAPIRNPRFYVYLGLRIGNTIRKLIHFC